MASAYEDPKETSTAVQLSRRTAAVSGLIGILIIVWFGVSVHNASDPTPAAVATPTAKTPASPHHGHHSTSEHSAAAKGSAASHHSATLAHAHKSHAEALATHAAAMKARTNATRFHDQQTTWFEIDDDHPAGHGAARS